MKLKKENLKYIIKETLVRIYEEQHISRTAEEWVGRIFPLILEHFKEIKFTEQGFSYNDANGGRIGCDYRVGHFDIDVEPFSMVRVVVFDFNCLEEINVFLKHSDLDSKYNDKDNKILLRTISINGKLSELYTKRVISHEVRHAFDCLKWNGFEPSQLYYAARGVMKRFNDKKNDVNYLIAILLYWFYNDEIYANCQGLYGELQIAKPKSFQEAKQKTNLYNEFIMLENIYNYLFKTFNNEISWYEKRLFLNMPLGKINSYLRKQIEYTRKRFDKVVYLYLKDKKYVNEDFQTGGCLLNRKIIL